MRTNLSLLTAILLCSINMAWGLTPDAGARKKVQTPFFPLSQVPMFNIEAASGGDSVNPYIYQWEFILDSDDDGNGDSDWQEIPGATGINYAVVNNTAPISYYRRKVTKGTDVAYSNTIKLFNGYIEIEPKGDTVNFAPVTIDSHFILEDSGSQIQEFKQGPGGVYQIIFKPNLTKNTIFGDATIVIYRNGVSRDIPISYDQASLFNPDYNKNQGTVTKYFAPSGQAPIHTTEYYDGSGRLSQKVNINADGQGGDIVELVVYDSMGRDNAIQYLPFVNPEGNGQRVTNPVTAQKAFYQTAFPGDPDTEYTFAQNEYDKSAGMVIGQKDCGENSNAHPIRFEYRLNTTEDGIKKYSISSDGKSLHFAKLYDENTLRVKISWLHGLPDSCNRVSYEYTDAADNIIAQEERLNNTDRRITYYVYDDLGRQRYIIPPIQDDQITSIGSDYAYNTLKKYCFYNEYDENGNLVKQYIPGIEPAYNIYDSRNRLVMTQLGTHRAANKWIYTKYDSQNRPVMTGIIAGGTYDSHYSAIRSQTIFGENRDSTAIHGYTNNCYPSNIDNNEVISIIYYDDYLWQTDGKYSFAENDALGNNYTNLAAGMVTGKKLKVIGTLTEPQWLTSATYYDQQYRIVQAVSDLYPSGTEIVSNTYTFAGNISRLSVRQKIEDHTYGYNKWYNYDNKERLLSIDYQVLDDAENGRVTLVAYTYNQLGNITEKKIHNGVETTMLGYRMTGATSSVTSESFSYNLGLDRPAEQGFTSRIDGNIASIAWGNGNTLDKGYNFSYDIKGQLTSAALSEKNGASWSTTCNYNEKNITYDKNGNILSLSRYDGSGSVLHDIIYHYDLEDNGNAISSVTVNGQTSAPFSYDANGNMIFDGMTGVGINYNILNLPEKIFAGSDTVYYIYNASGEKLATQINGSLTYYRNGLTYAESSSVPQQLQYIKHDEGIIAAESGGYTYKYFKTDHMGSTRVMLAAHNTENGVVMTIEQVTDYYPFGLSWENNNLQLNKLLYNGKELQDAQLGNIGLLALYDYAARYYNPVLGRWFGIDPDLQMASPYAYCNNNPMMFVDPDGRFFWMIPIITAAVFATTNLVIHAIKGDIHNFWDGLKFFGQGAITGFAVGTMVQLPVIGTILKVKFSADIGFTSFGLGVSLMTGNWQGMKNALEIFGGNFYSNENASFFGGTWQLLSKHTWEMPQNFAGHTYSQIRNMVGRVDRVDYLDGVVFATNENAKHNQGISLGGYSNISIRTNIDTDIPFREYVKQDPLFMHEYGHSFTSRRFGPLYLIVPGIPSLLSAATSNGSNKHKYRWYEIQANKDAEKYFGVDWSIFLDSYPLR